MKNTIKRRLAIISILILTVCIIGTTLAWLISQSSSITNTFDLVEVDSEVIIENSYNAKIKNISDIPAFLRVRVVTNWVNEDGDIAFSTDEIIVPEELKPNWVLHTDGYYYYTEPVDAATIAGGDTLFAADFTTLTSGGYKLQVEYLSEAIQADPIAAVTYAWGVDPTSLGN